MDYQFNSYGKFIKKFYSNITSHHPQSSTLNRRLSLIIKQVQGREQEQLSTNRRNRKIQNLSVSSRSKLSHSRSAHSYKHKQTIKNKNQGLIKLSNFGAILAFAYIYLIIDTESEDILKMIETKVKLLSDGDYKQKISDKANWDHSLMEWKKVLYLMEHKKTVKWQKILNTAFTCFTEKFIEIILRSILNIGFNTKLQVKPTQQFLKKIANQLKITIVYFKYLNKEVQDKNIYGNGKISMNLGYVQEQQKYACFEKFPQQQNKLNETKSNNLVNNNEKTSLKMEQRTADSFRTQVKTQKLITSIKDLSQTQKSNESPSKSINSTSRISKQRLNAELKRKKTTMTIQFLLKQYNGNTQKLRSLQCLNLKFDSKLAKIESQIGSLKRASN